MQPVKDTVVVNDRWFVHFWFRCQPWLTHGSLIYTGVLEMLVMYAFLALIALLTAHFFIIPANTYPPMQHGGKLVLLCSKHYRQFLSL